MSAEANASEVLTEACDLEQFRAQKVREVIAEYDAEIDRLIEIRNLTEKQLLFSKCEVLVENHIPAEISESEDTEIIDNEDSPTSSSTIINGQNDDESIVPRKTKRTRELSSSSECDSDMDITVSDNSTSDWDSDTVPKGNVKRKKTPVNKNILTGSLIKVKNTASNSHVKHERAKKSNAQLRKLVRKSPKFSLPVWRIENSIIDMATDGDASKAAAIAEEIEKNAVASCLSKKAKTTVNVELSSDDDDFNDGGRSFVIESAANSDDSSDIEISILAGKSKEKKQKKPKKVVSKQPKQKSKNVSSSSSSFDSDSVLDSDSLLSYSDDSDSTVALDAENDEEKENRSEKEKVPKTSNRKLRTRSKLTESQKKFNSLFKSPQAKAMKKRSKAKEKAVKNEFNSSSDSEDECEIIGEFDTTVLNSEESTNSGRRNIRRIMTEKELREATKKAQQEEKQRLQRLAEKGSCTAAVESQLSQSKRLVLEFDQEKNPLVEVHHKIAQNLKNHQREGIKFLWNCLIESVDALKSSEGSGCILAHSMGLGKSLQVIAFIHTLLSNELTNGVIKTCAVVCPKNTARNWANEFRIWLSKNNLKNVNIFEMDDCKTPSDRRDKLALWQRRGGVLIIGMTMFTKLIVGGKKVPESHLNTFRRYLADPGADIIICDEGHILKNSKTQINDACNQVKTKRRAILTGTPLQNNLLEYHVMMNFVKPDLLGSEKEFTNRFVNPINNGQHSDSTVADVKLMKKRVHILHKLLDGCVQRYDYRELVPYLEPKFEYTIYVKLTDLQIKLYQHYLDNYTQRERRALFKDHQVFMCILNHPCTLFSLKHLQNNEKRKLDGTEPMLLDSESDGIEDITNIVNGAGPSTSVQPSTSFQPSTSAQSSVHVTGREPELKDVAAEWFKEFISLEDRTKIEMSGKMKVLFSIISECDFLGEKLVVFSQSLIFLNLLEDCLRNENKGSVTWQKGTHYLRIDGSVDSDTRKKYIDKFNNPNFPNCRLFLVATRSGSLGINLYGASRCVLIDVCWNPTHDSQAVCRLYRLGQKRTVFVYRLVSQGTMEEKIYERQIIKQSLACRVVDEQQIERHFSSRDIAEFYNFFPNTSKERETPKLPKDNLLADLWKKHSDEIFSYREHDSLLENKPEEDLTEEERKIAWDEWEEEKDDEIRKQKEAEEAQKRREEQAKRDAEEAQKRREEILRRQQRIELTRLQNQNGERTEQVRPQQPSQVPNGPAQQQTQSTNVTFIFNQTTQNVPHSHPQPAHQTFQAPPNITIRPFHLGFQPQFQAHFQQPQTTTQTHTRPPPPFVPRQAPPGNRRQKAAPNHTTNSNRSQANQTPVNNPTSSSAPQAQASVGLPSYDKLIIEDVLRYLGIPAFSRNTSDKLDQLKEVRSILNRGIATVKSTRSKCDPGTDQFLKCNIEERNLNIQLRRLTQLLAVTQLQNNTANGIIIEEAENMQRDAPRRKTAAVLIEELD